MAWYDGPGDSVAKNLSLVIGEYESEREQYWSDEPEVAALLRVFDYLGEALLTASSDLTTPIEGIDTIPPGGSPWAAVLEIAEGNPLGIRLAEGIEIRVATHAIDSLSDSTQRCLALAKFVLNVQPGEQVARFLARLGRCFIAGFFPECVMLCRSTLESALREKFELEGIPLPGTERGVSAMRTRLGAALMLQWLSADGERAGVTVWERGNIAVHEDPLATRDVLGTIELTVQVLRELYERPPRRRRK